MKLPKTARQYNGGQALHSQKKLNCMTVKFLIMQQMGDPIASFDKNVHYAKIHKNGDPEKGE